MRLESDIIGTWIHVNAVPMRGGMMRLNSSWTFDADGRALLAIKVGLEYEGHRVTLNETNNIGHWSILADTLIVELPDHTDSPFRLSFNESGDLTSDTNGLWRRST